MVAFTLKLENLKIVADLVGKQVYLLVCKYCVYFMCRENVVIAVGTLSQRKEWRLVLCVKVFC